MEPSGSAPVVARPRILRPATAIDDLIASSDRYDIARSWLTFDCVELIGVVFWGSLEVAALRGLIPVLDILGRPEQKPRPLYIDLRPVDGFTREVFDLYTELLELNRAAAEKFTKAAIVYAPGIAGAFAMGLRELAPPPFDQQFFLEPVEAMRSLGCDRARPLVDELDELRREAFDATRVVHELRAMIDVKRRLTLDHAARSLAHSPRNLQRKLAQAGTTFQEELTLATVKVAQRMLLEPGANVTEVSLEVGCASPQHLSRLFRKVVGETPSGWRERQLRLRTG